jgi:hypothetical protein
LVYALGYLGQTAIEQLAAPINALYVMTKFSIPADEILTIHTGGRFGGQRSGRAIAESEQDDKIPTPSAGQKDKVAAANRTPDVVAAAQAPENVAQDVPAPKYNNGVSAGPGTAAPATVMTLPQPQEDLQPRRLAAGGARLNTGTY